MAWSALNRFELMVTSRCTLPPLANALTLGAAALGVPTLEALGIKMPAAGIKSLKFVMLKDEQIRLLTADRY